MNKKLKLFYCLPREEKVKFLYCVPVFPHVMRKWETLDIISRLGKTLACPKES